MRITFCSFAFLLIFNQLLISQDIHKYTVGNGPADFVLDTFSSTPRLIVSCHERRDKIKKKISYFYSIDLHSKQIQKMVRINEPENFYLSLAGIDLERINNKIYLYATSQYEKAYIIVKYQIKNDSLLFIKYYSNPLFYKLNNIAVHKGNFIVSNSKFFNGTIVYSDTSGNCKTLLKHINFPSGVLFENDSTFFYCSTFENSFVKNKLKDLAVTERKKIAIIKGADNIVKYNNKYYITSHPNFLKYIKHKNNSEKKSPTAVYEYEDNNGTLKPIFYNDGYLISAASSALMYKNKLFLSQVFDDFLLQIDFSSVSTSFNSIKK